DTGPDLCRADTSPADLCTETANSIQTIHPDVVARPPAGLVLDALLGNSEGLQTQRPRLAVALGETGSAESFSLMPYSEINGRDLDNTTPTVSWSLETWQMNTASLAHIQCSSASRTLESFLVENCRFVDQPTPSDAINLVQIEGRWMAAPGLQLGLGAFTGQQSMASESALGGMPINLPAVGPVIDSADMVDEVDGLSMNLSFGLQVGRIGDLMLDLELSRYRRTPDSFAFGNGLLDAGLYNIFAGGLYALQSQYQTAGQLGLGWRKNQFSADLVGQYRELPYWFGPEVSGEGFNSFDIEFSWRAPINSSISVGVSNVLNARPDAASIGDAAMENSIDSIYGRIPYVRYKHDL
ncbi:MAG: hypothetical protein AAF446_07740, partial [Pseudomonadota bacterium]